MKQTLVLAALCCALPAAAQVYKCKDGTTTVFSSQPCAPNAQPIDVRPASGASRVYPAPASEATPAPVAPPTAKPPVATRTLPERANLAARRRILDDEVWRKQQSINALHEEHQTRQRQLRNKKSWANNNLAGAVWEQSISDEMQAVAAEYDMQIRKATKELDEVRMRRAQVPND